MNLGLRRSYIFKSPISLSKCKVCPGQLEEYPTNAISKYKLKNQPKPLFYELLRQFSEISTKCSVTKSPKWTVTDAEDWHYTSECIKCILLATAKLAEPFNSKLPNSIPITLLYYKMYPFLPERCFKIFSLWSQIFLHSLLGKLQMCAHIFPFSPFPSPFVPIVHLAQAQKLQNFWVVVMGEWSRNFISP